MRIPTPFNPLDRENLAASAGQALLETNPEPLGSFEPFRGVGVYALYYTGDFPPYQSIRDANVGDQWLAPIYIGKAIPKGGRTGTRAVEDRPGLELKSRLDNHAKSIKAASSTLSIDDFYARYLVVTDIFIPLIEGLMISRFAPAWNTIIYGFGSNVPGKGREEGTRSRWDTLHPGRPSAKNLKDRTVKFPNETAAGLAREVEEVLASRAVPEQNIVKP